MIDIDEVQDMLDDLAEEMSEIFYKDLNEKILLLPEAMISQYAQGSSPQTDPSDF